LFLEVEMSEIYNKRKELISQYGPEITIKCCRDWKTHFFNGRWGLCGICLKIPMLKSWSWNDE
jgi:hypothetical protein